MKIQYAVLDDDPDAETKFSTTTGWEHDNLDYVAEDCAEDYVARHDGWEGWDHCQSRAFALFSEEGLPLGVYDVTMELEPTYRASLRPPDPQ